MVSESSLIAICIFWMLMIAAASVIAIFKALKEQNDEGVKTNES